MDADEGRSPTTGDAAHVRVRWWTPGRADWQVAALFALGSTCFVLGATPGYASLVGVQADCWTYAIGSVFFTLAALLQVLISLGVVRAEARPLAAARWRHHVRALDRPAWWAGTVQLAGTVLFNVSTFAALDASLTLDEAQRRVWAPDALGSVAFLVASALAFADVARPWVAWRPRDLTWAVATLNLVGSVAFGVSAVAAKYVPSGELRDAALANLGTFVGGVCFLVGAVLLVPDQQEQRAPTG
ncbi:YrhK family protein [Cellulomonas soli]|uniref:Uncharacterized protein n=1 Tax=Cellulomonas soli TaxID=931535 RepID=A0A512PDQ1_9CELL|nr:YrhK family protein [Cellulomonas soli]NYI60006.1 hypothetical protein [Cellulomonas soli]GEP69341.1 hypothetical protein CSO01_20560 [Cellulomonas soli]